MPSGPVSTITASDDARHTSLGTEQNGSSFCIVQTAVGALTLSVGRQEEHPVCKMRDEVLACMHASGGPLSGVHIPTFLACQFGCREKLAAGRRTCSVENFNKQPRHRARLAVHSVIIL